MLELFAEGIESLRLPCSYVVLAPAIGIALFARRRSPLTIGAYVIAATLVAWLRFAGWWIEAPSGITQVLSGAAFVLVGVVAFRNDRAESDAFLGFTTGTVAVWSWIPCVGPELGNLINRVGTSPWSNAAGTAAYVVGLLVPFVVIAAAEAAFPTVTDRLDRAWIRLVGAMVVLLVGILVTLTLFDDLASELAQRSTF